MSLTNGEQTAKEVDQACTFLKREGKVDKETYDWFARKYKRDQSERGKSERQQQSYSPRLSV